MRYVAILTALALALMGCGGSDGDADPSSTTTTTSEAGTTTAPTNQATTTTEADDNGSGSDFVPEDCETLMNWAMDSVSASQAAFSGGGTSLGGVEFSSDYFQAFVDEAPEEIADDMQVFADAFNAFWTALEDMGIDFTDPSAMASMTAAQAQQLEEITELLDTDAVDQASENIEAFFEEECGG